MSETPYMVKKIKVGVLSVFVLLLVGKRELTGLAESASDISKMPQPPTIFAQAAVMMDGENGRILYEKNAEKFLPMASTTKIMTCIVALEQADMNETVTVSEYAASMPDVQLNIRAGERYRMQDLLYSLMLESHNDSAVAIAEAVAGSEGAFAKMMNQKARDIGCSDTNFITPNGLDSRNMETGEIRSKIFYCDPMQSSQKPHVENNHIFIREMLPNGQDWSHLTQDKMNLMFSHINSTPRESLGGKTPYEIFTFIYGKELANKLNIQEIRKDEVTTTPHLLKLI